MKLDDNYAWRKSRYSSNQPDCVELAVGPAGGAVRDTKNRQGGSLWFERTAFEAFLAVAAKAKPGDLPG